MSHKIFDRNILMTILLLLVFSPLTFNAQAENVQQQPEDGEITQSVKDTKNIHLQMLDKDELKKLKELLENRVKTLKAREENLQRKIQQKGRKINYSNTHDQIALTNTSKNTHEIYRTTISNNNEKYPSL